MKKFKFIIFICFLFFPSVVFADADTYTETISIPVMDDVLETAFNGTWKPSLLYLRTFQDAVPLDDIYRDDIITIADSNVSITLMGHYFDGLPYEYRNSTVLTAINYGKPNVIYINFALLDPQLMLYTICFVDKRYGEIRMEIFCIKQGEQD